jgi:hypothetical protein
MPQLRGNEPILGLNNGLVLPLEYKSNENPHSNSGHLKIL